VLNKVVYDDIKLELTDHIASDIEVIMTADNVSYEDALKEAFDKWSVQLKPKTGFWNPEKNRFTFSKMDVQPKLIMDKLESISKLQLLNMIIFSTVITSLVFGIMKRYDSGVILLTVGEVYKILSLVLIGLLFFGRIFRFKFKSVTTYGHLFKVGFFRIIWMPFFNLIWINSLNHFKHPSLTQTILIVFVMTFGLIRGVLSLRLLYKHVQFEKQLSKV
jgi:hypothetical protein